MALPASLRRIRKAYAEDIDVRRAIDRVWELARAEDAAFEPGVSEVLALTSGEPRETRLPARNAIRALKALAELGLGRFIVGRKGRSSRFNWDYTPGSVRQAALRETEELVEMSEREANDNASDAVQEGSKAAGMARWKEVILTFPDRLTDAEILQITAILRMFRTD